MRTPHHRTIDTKGPASANVRAAMCVELARELARLVGTWVGGAMALWKENAPLEYESECRAFLEQESATKSSVQWDWLTA